jgi:hypothetical protein
VRPSVGGVEHYALPDFERGNVGRASATSPPTGQKVTVLPATRVVDNLPKRVHKPGPQFDATDLLAIPGATPAQYCPYKL